MKTLGDKYKMNDFANDTAGVSNNGIHTEQ